MTKIAPARLFRGEYDGTPTANSTFTLPLFDANGNILTLGANDRLFVQTCTIVQIPTAAQTVNIRAFFDTFGDGLYTGLAAPTLAAAGSGSSIAAGTYTLSYSFYDPFSGSETPLSATQTVTPTIGQNITVTAPVTIPAFMVDANGNKGYIKVYRNDGGNTGLLAVGLPGANSLVLTSVTALAPQPPASGQTSSGKGIALGLWNVTDLVLYSESLIEPGVIGPPGVPIKVNTSGGTIPTIVHARGVVVQNQQLP